MVEDVDDLTVAYEADGEVLVEELDKRVLSDGAWATVVFKLREYSRSAGALGATKYSLRRYQKQHGVYRQRSKINLASPDEAAALVAALSEWLAEDDA